MFSLSHSLLSVGITMFVVGTGMLGCDALQACRRPHLHTHGGASIGLAPEEPAAQWRTSLALTLLAWSPLVVTAAVLAAFVR